ncbi:MAG TPA: DUF4440 domain-containing protein [Candidatus Binataceae bacterium]
MVANRKEVPLYVLMITLGLLALFMAQGRAAADSTSAAQGEIRAALVKWMADFNAGNSQEVCSLFAPDLISDYQGVPENNFASLCTRLKKSVSNRTRTYHYDLDLKEILVSGDLAMVRLQWTLKVQQKGLPDDVTVDLGLDVFRRQPDGTWKIARFLSYPMSPPGAAP